MAGSELPTVVEFSVDLNDQEAPEPLPAGEYRGVISKTERRESKDRGTMYGAISFRISSDQYPADFTEGPEEGLTLVFRRVGLEDNPQSRYGTKRFMEAIGAPLSKKFDMVEWVGLEAAVDVVHDTYEGVTRAVIDRVRAV